MQYSRLNQVGWNKALPQVLLLISAFLIFSFQTQEATIFGGSDV